MSSYTGHRTSQRNSCSDQCHKKCPPTVGRTRYAHSTISQVSESQVRWPYRLAMGSPDCQSTKCRTRIGTEDAVLRHEDVTEATVGDGVGQLKPVKPHVKRLVCHWFLLEHTWHLQQRRGFVPAVQVSSDVPLPFLKIRLNLI